MSRNSTSGEFSSLAVALSYNAATKGAPQISAKGQHKLADEIRRIALRYGVPLKANLALAEQLALLECDERIPGELYDEVAHLFLELEHSQF